MSPAIDCHQLGKRYTAGFRGGSPRMALEGLTLQVPEGEVFGFLGHNGAGKSTTFKLLLGLMQASSGTARVLGEPPGSRQALRQIGFLPESPWFYEHLSGRELLEYYGRLSGLSGQCIGKRVDELAEALDLGQALELPLRRCSKGMLQRVGLAQAVLHRPRLLFLDEPMSGLDPLGRRQVRELMLQWRREGTTIFFSTHILGDAEQICDRVAILRRGRLMGVGTLPELLSDGEERVEIVWRQERGVAPELPEWRALPQPNSHRAVVPQAEIWAALERLRESGAVPVSATPMRRPLEELYVALASG